MLVGSGLLAFGATNARAALDIEQTGAYEGTRANTIDGVISLNEYGPFNGQVFTGSGFGFGGSVGNAAVYMASDLTNLDIALVLGGNLSDLAVIYLNTRAGGFGDADMNDQLDSGRATVSNLASGGTETFPASLSSQPDFALVMGPTFTALFELDGSMTNGSLIFIATTNAGHGAADLTPRETRIALADLGVVPGDTIEFFVAYCSDTGFLSNESIPSTPALNFGANPGTTGGATFENHDAFVLAEAAIDLAAIGTTFPGFRIDGIDPGDNSGWSVSGAGDVNGDGLADLIVGAPRAAAGGVSLAGESYVVFGKTNGAVVDLAALGTGGFRIDGIDVFDLSGACVSGAGDVNGDGLADLIVGAYFADPGGDSLAGESYVVFGKAGNATVDLAALGAGGFRIDGIDAGDYAGFALSGAGDVNGDGLADLIVGAQIADPGGDSGAGESYVIFGKTDGATVDLSALGTGGFRIDGIDAGDYSGFAVSGAGDVNGDGLADLIVGAYGADPGGDVLAGESYVVFGKADGTAVDLSALGAGGFRIDGIDVFDFSGHSVSGAGDVNGDGLADLIIGASAGDPGGDSAAGESYVVFGKADGTAVDLSALGAGGFRIDGIDPTDQAGFCASGAGDVNGDGRADLIVGAIGADPGGDSAAGESYVVFGKASSTAVDLAALGADGFRIDGIDADDFSGFFVSGAGDVDGDGLADVIVGANQADPGGDLTAGESYVVFSTSTPPATATYRAYAGPGAAQPLAVGLSGDGSNDSTPDARCWIDFDAGDDGSGGASLQTVTLHRNQDLGSLSSPTVWEITSDRTGWSSAALTFKYTDAEIGALTEANLTIYKSSSLGGPYTPLATTVDTARNTVSATVSSFSFFAIGDSTGLPVEITTLQLE